MHRRRHLFMMVPVLVLAAASLACYTGAEDPVAVSFDEACAEDDRPVTVEGVLGLGDTTYCETNPDNGEGTCDVLLFHPDDSSQSVTATLDLGSGANQMVELPDTYADSDFQFYDSAGASHGVKTRVRISGTSHNDMQGYTCRIMVDTIELVP